MAKRGWTDNEGSSMGLGTSLFLMAAGAILRWAVNVNSSAIDLHTVGLILLIVGGIGFVISLFWMTVYADRHAGRTPAMNRPPMPPTNRPPTVDERRYRDIGQPR